MIKLDGSYLEGGGQIVRTAIAMSAVTNTPVIISNIRKGRKRPGLAAQHLTAIKAVAKICGAFVKGAVLGSSRVEFRPVKIRGGSFRFDVGTAGSIPLVLQALMPAALHADRKVEIEIIGGTSGIWAPSIDYFEKVYCAYLEAMRANIQVDIIQRGFYPKGGGRVKVIIEPKRLAPLVATERGDINRIDLFSTASEVLKDAKVGERMLKGFYKNFTSTSRIGKYVETVKYIKTYSPGASFLAVASSNNCRLGAVAVGERGKRAEVVGSDAAKRFNKEMESRAVLDEKMADQIIPFIGLTGHSSFRTSRISSHLRTNIWVVEHFLQTKFKIQGDIVKAD